MYCFSYIYFLLNNGVYRLARLDQVGCTEERRRTRLSEMSMQQVPKHAVIVKEWTSRLSVEDHTLPRSVTAVY